jgi:hypothetical protein
MAKDTSDQRKSVLTAGGQQTRAGTSKQLLNQNAPPAVPSPNRGRKSAITRESVVEDVVEIIRKEVDVTPTSRSSSVKKVSFQVDGQIVAPIDDGVIDGQRDFETAMERVATADDDVDFGGQDNDHAEESKEEKDETREVGGYPKKKKSVTLDVVSVVGETFCVTLH